MKRTILLLLSIVSILSLSSCGDDDKPVVQSIEISKSEASVKVGEKITLTVSHSPADLPAPEYEWNSSDETIATVENGIVYGKSVGEVTISVSSFNLKLKDICKVTVTPIEATDIKLSESEKTMTTGESFRLEYTIEPENTTNKEVEWESSDKTIATVNADGEVTAVSDGECTITVKVKGSDTYAKCVVKVNPIKVTGVTLNETTKSIEAGKSFTLTATVSPENAKDKSIKWSSSDPNIAKVEDGLVTALAKGTCNIIATTNDGNFKAQCTVNVLPFSVKGVQFTESSVKILNGESYTLTYSILPENAENKNVKFSSSAPNTVSVDNNGKVTALKEGTSTITITTEDGAHTATCEVVSAEISDFMNLGISSSSIVSINGYITGSVYCYITNTSSKEISLTKFEVKDGLSENIVLYTDDASKLSALAAGQTTNLGGQMRYVYLPIFIWTFNYAGKEYKVSKQYKQY
ncbi:Ig domain-containing protein [Bacteroides fragilis]